MRHLIASAAALTLAATLLTAGGGEKPEPSVTYVRTWDAAVEEAKLLNLPIVVHNHGFY
jgi:hypothetical protein